MKMSEVLAKARRRIADKVNHHICYAIGDISGCVRYVDRVRAKEYVMGLLGYSGTLEQWYHKHHRKLYKKATSADFRTVRLNWLDWMIADCKERGD